MTRGLKHLIWGAAALVICMSISTSALSGPAGSGPEYPEYQAPIAWRGDLLAGGLVCFAAFLAACLLALSERPRAGVILGAVGLALGVFQTVCKVEIR